MNLEREEYQKLKCVKYVVLNSLMEYEKMTDNDYITEAEALESLL